MNIVECENCGGQGVDPGDDGTGTFLCTICGGDGVIKLSIEEIRGKLHNHELFYAGDSEGSYKAIVYLLSIIEQAEKVITVAVKHIDGKAEKFSEREKIPVLFQLNEALQAIRK